MAQLLWAYNHQPEGPAMWFWFGTIEDWRQMLKNELDGRPFSPADCAVIEKNRKKIGKDCYSPEAKRAIDLRKDLPKDPYRREWHKLNVADMFVATEVRKVYDELYRPLSGFLHWNPKAIFISLEMPNGIPVRYRHSNPKRAANVLSAGFQALSWTIEALITHFNLPVSENLENLRGEFKLASDRRLTSMRDAPKKNRKSAR